MERLRASPPLLQNRAKDSPGVKEAAPARKGQPWQELGPTSPGKPTGKFSPSCCQGKLMQY
ncbi:unnamed protein product [Prunus armeniaca]